MKKKSLLAPKKYQNLDIIQGIRIASTHCGFKKNNKDDLVLIKFDKPCTIFSYLTKSKTPGEPVKWNRSIKKYEKVSVILINSGNANVFTGRAGRLSINRIVKDISEKLCIDPNQIYIASTGIIGEILDEKKIISSLPNLITNLKNNSEVWHQAANAIKTTDTFPKIVKENLKYNNDKIKINGIAKGSGMIAPNMATMLAFIFTNISLDKANYKVKIQNIIEHTFNSITVDSDMSTSDMVLFISDIRTKKEKKLILQKKIKKEFDQKLELVMQRLAHLIVKDGEGAKKFISILISGAKSYLHAKKIALSIANSPLFKTAMAGSDSNWGRIIMAIGKSNIKINSNKISILFGSIIVIENGEIVKFDQKKMNTYLAKQNIELTINLNLGNYSSKVWTCDLTKEYISINADYRS